MNEYKVTLPTEGSVTLTLDWQEAEVLTRVVGLVNAGDLSKHAPTLYRLVTQLVEEFGRNNESEAENYIAKTGMGQVYIEAI